MFSVGLVYYSGLSDIIPCIDSLLSQDFFGEYEILFRDQSSSKEALLYLTKNYSDAIRTEKIKIWNGKNEMHSGGHNFLVSHASFPYYICGSIDMTYTSSFLSSFAQAISQFSDASVWGGKILQKKAFLIDSVGISKTWYGRFYERGYGFLPSLFEKHEYVWGISGALFCIRIADIPEPFLFEPSLHYKNDVELMDRLQKSQKKVLYFPDVVGYHHRLVSQDAKKSLFVLRSSLQGQKFMFKNMSFLQKIPAFFFLGMQYIRLWVYVVKTYFSSIK